jgi:hypothetical protein
MRERVASEVLNPIPFSKLQIQNIHERKWPVKN